MSKTLLSEVKKWKASQKKEEYMYYPFSNSLKNSYFYNFDFLKIANIYQQLSAKRFTKYSYIRRANDLTFFFVLYCDPS